MIFGRPPRAERIGLGGQVDWSQEEQEVQRMLGNFRSNLPENVAEPVPANNAWGEPPRYMVGDR